MASHSDKDLVPIRGVNGEMGFDGEGIWFQASRIG